MRKSGIASKFFGALLFGAILLSFSSLYFARQAVPMNGPIPVRLPDPGVTPPEQVSTAEPFEVSTLWDGDQFLTISRGTNGNDLILFERSGEEFVPRVVAENGPYLGLSERGFRHPAGSLVYSLTNNRKLTLLEVSESGTNLRTVSNEEVYTSASLGIRGENIYIGGYNNTQFRLDVFTATSPAGPFTEVDIPQSGVNRSFSNGGRQPQLVAAGGKLILFNEQQDTTVYSRLVANVYDLASGQVEERVCQIVPFRPASPAYSSFTGATPIPQNFGAPGGFDTLGAQAHITDGTVWMAVVSPDTNHCQAYRIGELGDYSGFSPNLSIQTTIGDNLTVAGPGKVFSARYDGNQVKPLEEFSVPLGGLGVAPGNPSPYSIDLFGKTPNARLARSEVNPACVQVAPQIVLPDTEIEIVNLDNRPAQLALNLYVNPGELIDGSPLLTLPPFGSTTFEPASTTPGGPVPAVLRIDSFGGNPAIFGQWNLFPDSIPAGFQGVGLDSAWGGPVKVGSGINTGISIANPWENSISCAARVNQPDGTVFRTRTFGVAGRSSNPRFVTELFPGMPDDFSGSISIECNRPVAGVQVTQQTEPPYQVYLTPLQGLSAK